MLGGPLFVPDKKGELVCIVVITPPPFQNLFFFWKQENHKPYRQSEDAKPQTLSTKRRRKTPNPIAQAIRVSNPKPYRQSENPKPYCQSDQGSIGMLNPKPCRQSENPKPYFQNH